MSRSRGGADQARGMCWQARPAGPATYATTNGIERFKARKPWIITGASVITLAMSTGRAFVESGRQRNTVRPQR